MNIPSPAALLGSLRGESRSALLKRNILASFLIKGASMTVSFIFVPLTIHFVNPVQYGIWLTLSSLLAWFSFFDIGLSLGFRNRFAEATARGDTTLARQYVSTTYAALSALVTLMLLIALPVNHFIDWPSLLKVDPAYGPELTVTFAAMIAFFGLTMAARTISALVTADQRVAIASLIDLLGQATALLLIWLLTRFQTHGSLAQLTFIYSGAPFVVLALATVLLFARRYRPVAPSFRAVRPALVRSILGIGAQFFIITTSMLFIFQLINVIISRNLGPATVTQYNIAYKYLNIPAMLAVLVLNPFWSAFTHAHTRGDFAWMRAMIRRLERLYCAVALPVVALMAVCAPWFYAVWVGSSVTVPAAITLAVAAYVLLYTLSNIYMYLINGIGKVRIQLIIYVAFAMVAYPLMNAACARWGIPGMLAVPAAVYLAQAIAIRTQLHLIITQKATGLWNK